MMGFYPRPMPMPFGPCAPCPCPPRECHKEFKELLVVAEVSDTGRVLIETQAQSQILAQASSDRQINIQTNEPIQAADTSSEKTASGTGTAVIGGGCCVHLAVEYMPVPATTAATREVVVRVMDSENAMLTWTKKFTEGYHVKENIITTYPGATLSLRVVNAIARVRWSETYSG
jgi:hypothetical protein